MIVKFSVKQIAKKRPFIQAQPIEIAGEWGESLSLRELLARVVSQQVTAFNEQRGEKTLFAYFQEAELAEEAQTGKVRFGAIYNENKADAEKAVETVLLAVYDGIIAVFIDDEQITELDQAVVLQESSLVTFVRLTFLAGSVW